MSDDALRHHWSLLSTLARGIDKDLDRRLAVVRREIRLDSDDKQVLSALTQVESALTKIKEDNKPQLTLLARTMQGMLHELSGAELPAHILKTTSVVVLSGLITGCIKPKKMAVIKLSAYNRRYNSH